MSYAICAEPASGGNLEDLINNVFSKGPDDGGNQPINNGGGQQTNNGGGQSNNNGGGQSNNNGGGEGNFPDVGGLNVINID